MNTKFVLVDLAAGLEPARKSADGVDEAHYFTTGQVENRLRKFYAKHPQSRPVMRLDDVQYIFEVPA